MKVSGQLWLDRQIVTESPIPVRGVPRSFLHHPLLSCPSFHHQYPQHCLLYLSMTGLARQVPAQPSPIPHAHGWYGPGPAVYCDSTQSGTAHLCSGTPVLTSAQSVLNAPEDAVRRRVDLSSTLANPTLGTHWCLTLPGRRSLRLFGISVRKGCPVRERIE